MTDAELRDQAISYLRKTTSRYSLKLENDPTTNWGKAFGALNQIGTVPVPDPVPTPTPTITARELGGVCAYAQADLALIASLGIRHIRIDFSKATDSFLGECRTRGIRVLLIADYAMGYGVNGDHSMPSNYSAWALKVAARVKGWEDVIEAVEVWNEPWLSSFWSPTPDPARYLDLVLACASAVWAVSPNMLIVVSLDYNANVQVVGFTDHLWRKHILDLDKGFLKDPRIRGSIHCYCQKLSPDQNVTDVQNGFQRWHQASLDAEAHGMDKRMWVTEWGWESTTAGQWGNYPVTEQQQADYITRGIQLMLGSGEVERAHIFMLQSNNTWGYCLLNGTTPKPAALALKGLIGT